MKKPKPIGQQLRAARLARGFRTQKQLAKAAGVDPSWLSKIERGDAGRRLVNPSLPDLAQALKAKFVTDGKRTVLELEGPRDRRHGDIRNRVLGLLRAGVQTISEMASQTGLTRCQVRGVLNAADLRGCIQRCDHNGVTQYQLEE